MVGGRHDIPGGFNRAFQALRQPGSAIKAVVYSAALDPDRGGPPLAPNSTVPDRLREFKTGQEPWRPHNDEGEYHDQVTLAKALAKSLNLATANLVEAIDPRTVARYGERFGLRGLKPVPSVGLGTTEVTLIGITDAYTTFPNGGMRYDANPIRAVMGPSGKPFRDLTTKPTRVIPKQTASLMTGMLEDVVTFGVSNPLRKKYSFWRPVGGKTGTTNDYHDAWFVGFTPDIVAGVWVGYDQPKTLMAPASEIALPVWAKVTTGLLKGVPYTEFASDHEVQYVWIDPWSGKRASRNCPSLMWVPFLPGTSPRDSCTLDHTADWLAKIAKRTADSLTAIGRGVARANGKADSTSAAQP
jgi:penicillin-binding protein 1A